MLSVEGNFFTVFSGDVGAEKFDDRGFGSGPVSGEGRREQSQLRSRHITHRGPFRFPLHFPCTFDSA